MTRVRPAFRSAGMAVALAAALPACGQGTNSKAADTPMPQPTPTAPLPGFNPLIGVWARQSGACRFGTVQFTTAQMTSEPANGGTMTTVPVSYDTSSHGSPVARPAGSQPLRFRVIDADHLGDDTDCVLARAD